MTERQKSQRSAETIRPRRLERDTLTYLVLVIVLVDTRDKWLLSEAPLLLGWICCHAYVRVYDKGSLQTPCLASMLRIWAYLHCLLNGSRGEFAVHIGNNVSPLPLSDQTASRHLITTLWISRRDCGHHVQTPAYHPVTHP